VMNAPCRMSSRMSFTVSTAAIEPVMPITMCFPASSCDFDPRMSSEGCVISGRFPDMVSIWRTGRGIKSFHLEYVYARQRVAQRFVCVSLVNVVPVALQPHCRAYACGRVLCVYGVCTMKDLHSTFHENSPDANLQNISKTFICHGIYGDLMVIHHVYTIS